jgi:hypothetical protein
MPKKRQNSVEMSATNRRSRLEDENELDDCPNDTRKRSTRGIFNHFPISLLKTLKFLFLMIDKSKNSQPTSAYNESSREAESIESILPTPARSTYTKQTPTGSNRAAITNSNKTPTTSNNTPTSSRKTSSNADKTQNRASRALGAYSNESNLRHNSNVRSPTSAIEQINDDLICQMKEKIDLAFSEGKKGNFKDVRFLIGNKTKDYTSILQFFDGPTQFEEGEATGRKGKLYAYECLLCQLNGKKYSRQCRLGILKLLLLSIFNNYFKT